MKKYGKYIYCIISSNHERIFGPIGLGNEGNDVVTFACNGMGVVLSGYPLVNVAVNRENMLTHQRVLETVMTEFDSVIPVRFGAIALGFDEIRNFLDRRHKEIRTLLINMQYKIELGVKGYWHNMESIFGEITKENLEIKKMKTAVKRKSISGNINTRIEIGRKVEQALNGKKEKETEWIIEKLRRSAVDYKLNETICSTMFMNASFLVDKGREKEFDNIMSILDDTYKNKIKFIYTGPLPVYNFVNTVINLESWER